MFDKRLSLIALCSLLLLSLWKPPAQAQTTQPTRWTTQEAVRYAIENSPNAQAAQHRIESAEADIRRAKAAFYPQLSVAGEYARTNNPMYSFGNILNQGVFSNSIDFNQPGLTDNLQLKALLAYRFYNGGSDQAGLDMAHHRQQAAELQQQSLHSQLGYTVVRAFFTIVQAEETVQARESAVASLAASLKVAQARFDEGDLLKEELLNLQVQHSLARENLIQTQHGLALARRGFLNLLGLTTGEPEVDLAGSTFQQVPGTPDFHQRPEINAMKAIVASFEDGVRKSRAGYYPTADAFGSYQIDKGYELDEGSGNSWLAGVRVNMSLFNGHQTSAEVERAKAQLAEAKKQLNQMELAYNLEIEQALLGLEQAEKRIQVTSQMVDSAIESARLSRERFKEGLLLSSELIDTENRLTDAKVRNAVANAEQRIAVADLRRAAGLMQYPK
ncbi:TolC family protein [Desulfogranum marinum]|uniref:TolC family protein n=1 Tax=Desulfogranum marinum TaxID=453220 RepID=UPI001962908C|nr:TolC family protein [Desulfogranum marinum]MBM9511281.1 TolC family protein [Desulfogranum marinum]